MCLSDIPSDLLLRYCTIDVYSGTCCDAVDHVKFVFVCSRAKWIRFYRKFRNYGMHCDVSNGKFSVCNLWRPAKTKVEWDVLKARNTNRYRQTEHRLWIPLRSRWKHFDPIVIHSSSANHWMRSANGTSIDPMMTAMHLCHQNDANFVVAVGPADAGRYCIGSDFVIDWEIHQMLHCHFYRYFPVQSIVCTPVFFNRCTRVFCVWRKFNILDCSYFCYILQYFWVWGIWKRRWFIQTNKMQRKK